MVVPGGAFPPGYPSSPVFPGVGPQPNELHMPAPSDMIRPPAPAVPIPAPGDASLPFPSSGGVPVKVGQK
jgi:hypothetical protein